MPEPKETKKTVKQIFDQARSIAARLNYRGERAERVMAIADRYAKNAAEYLGNNYNINKEVPRSVYMGLRKKNNRS